MVRPVDEAKLALERQRANKQAAEHAAKLKALHDAEEEQNFWLWVRYYNQLAKSHAKAAKRYEELCDSLLEGGTK